MRITLTLLLCLACAEPTLAPVDPTLNAFEGTFVLQSLNEQPLPLLQLDYSLTRQYLVADTLWADGRGNYARATVTEVDSVAHPYKTRSESRGSGKYTIRGDTVDFVGNCHTGGPPATCAPPTVGWRTSDPDANLVLALRATTTTGFAYIQRFRRVQ